MAGRSIIGFGDVSNTSTTTTRAFGAGTAVQSGSGENRVQFVFNNTGTISRPGIGFGTDTGGTGRTVVLRKNNAASLTLSVADGGSGYYVDSTESLGTTAIAAADGLAVGRAVASGTSLWQSAAAVFTTATATAYTFHAANNGGSLSVGSASTSRYVPTAGRSANYSDADANAETRITEAGSITHAFCNTFNRNFSADVTWTLYLNGSATALVITFTSGSSASTERFVAAGGPITVAAGDRVVWRETIPAGTFSGSYITWGLTFEPTSGVISNLVSRGGTGLARTGSATVGYHPPLGRIVSTTTEGLVQMKLGFPFRVRSIHILTGTSGYDYTATVRNEGADTGVAVTQSSGASGWASYSSSTADFTATEQISVKISGGTSGSTTLHAMVISIEDMTGAGGGASTGNFFLMF